MPKATPGAQVRVPFNLVLLKNLWKMGGGDTELQFGIVKFWRWGDDSCDGCSVWKHAMIPTCPPGCHLKYFSMLSQKSCARCYGSFQAI